MDGDTEVKSMGQTILTQKGLVKLKEELQHVKGTNLPTAEARHKLAKAYGYIKGDYEHDDSKAERDFHKNRIKHLESMIESAKII